MQLKRPAHALRNRLIAASCTLLGATTARAGDLTSDASPAADAAPASDAAQTVADTALAYYAENNGRVRAIEPIVNLRQDLGDERALSVKLTFDSLSGATPNGAVPSARAQTFASPSGHSLTAAPQTYTTASGQSSVVSSPIYTIAPGQLPMDPNYHDQRLAASGSYQMPWSSLTRTTYGGDLSYEHDFISVSGNGALAHDFNQKNTTLSLGGNYEFDFVRPIGGAPVAGSDYTLFEKQGSHTKHDANIVLGVTQVMTRRWLSELSLSYDRLNGYLNDPYKILSIVDGGGNVTGYLYERRPDHRARSSVYLENRLALDRAMAGLTLRYMSDDWGIHSETAQLKLRWSNAERDRYLEPQLRWYRQTAASFYTPWLSSAGSSYITAASSDERLGAFHAVTWGLKYAARFPDDQGGDGSELSIRAELYRQTPDHRLPGPGALSGLNLYPGLQALLVQVEWRFGY